VIELSNFIGYIVVASGSNKTTDEPKISSEFSLSRFLDWLALIDLCIRLKDILPVK